MKDSFNRRDAGTRTTDELLNETDSQMEGLSTEEAERRLKKYGDNRLQESERRRTWQILIAQLKSVIVGLLVVAAAVSFGFGQVVEGIAITVVIIINTAIGFFTELKAVRSMEALQKLGSLETTVRRDGEEQKLPAEKLVVGDVVILESGDVVTADMRLLEANKLQADESALTGESTPVGKQEEKIHEDVPLAEQKNMVFKGTAITRGSGKGLVVATGMDTELGEISTLVEEAEEEITPLERRLAELGHKLVWATLIVAVFVALSGIIVGKPIFLMIETAIALAVASIPEGLPIVATIALARGMRRMAKRNALINKLSSVETLGTTNVICTDKTGTLTENKMTVKKYVLNMKEFRVTGEGFELDGKFLRNDDEVDLQENEILKDSIMTGVLCNNATLPDVDSEKIEDEALSKVTGDPMEVALLVCGRKAGMNRDGLLESMPEVREVAFDPEVMMMATFHKLEDGSYKVAVKGSPQAVLDGSTTICTNDGNKQIEKERNTWIKKNAEMAEDGLRVLALATKVVDSPDADPYDDLTFLGLVGLIDPPRDDIRESIQLCQDAGVEVIMVTGDQTPTAKKVGKAVDLVDDDKSVEAAKGGTLKDIRELSHEERQELLQTRIFSRLNPKQKLDLIALHQEDGSVVAMTGDGVNDAPALKKADIGVAMGKHGTQVAHEAADVILKDDAFSTIIAAIKYGRVIFRNIRKFVIYLLSGNAGEILIVGIASLLNAPLPLLPTQILYLNFVADVFPALALGVGEGTNKVMERPPRNPQEPIMAKRHWMAIGGYGILIAITVLAAFFIALKKFGFPEEQATTIAFLTLAIARLWHVFNMRDFDSNIFINAVTKNKWVWRALGLCVILMLCAVYVPLLADVLYIVVPSTQQWVFIFGMSLIPLIVLQILKMLGVDKLGK